MEVSAGIKVSARGLLWDVMDVEPLGHQQRLRLRCSGGDLADLEWDLLHPAEKVEVFDTGLRPDCPGSLAAWRLYHTACLLDQLPNEKAMLATEPGRLRIEPYQLVPLMRALEMPRPRLLLADGVGLGKTIQAGLIAAELIARRRAHRIIVVSPAGPLLTQWGQELRHRFGLRFIAIADAASLRTRRAALDLGSNPFSGTAFCLTSLDFAKQEHILEDLERASWDLAIIDEAHHCFGTPGVGSQDDTQRRRLAEVLSRRSDALLLLTATPHDGHDPHFASLIELLDPSLTDGAGGLVGLAYRRHVIRRLKSHVRDAASGSPLFRERRVIPVRIGVEGANAAPVRAFHESLSALVAPRLVRGARVRGLADALAFVSLLKRSVSTIAAAVGTLRTVAERYASLGEQESAAITRERARALRAYHRQAERYGVLGSAEESDLALLEAEDMAARLRATGTAEALHRLIHLGGLAEPQDPKLLALIEEIRLIRAESPLANILVYTEYADSQDATVRALRTASSIAGEVLTISGHDSEEDRTRAAERCASEDGIILVSTDSLAEGLNLQQRCCHLIHLDLPYNPNRLEQRNGRIDRYGQRDDPQIRYLYLGGTFEEHLLLRLIAKYEKARTCLTFMPDTLAVTADADALGRGLVAGFAEEQASLFDSERPPIHSLDRIGEETNHAAYRDLLHEIDRAFDGFDRMAVQHGWAAQGLNAATEQANAAAGARKRGVALQGQIDLTSFVAATLACEHPGAVTQGAAASTVLHLAERWAAELDGLPGYDHANRALHIARRPCDSGGSARTVLGRAHPLVRRAIGHVSLGSPESRDHRVAAARAIAGDAPALLLTYSFEIRNALRPAQRQVIAVYLRRDGQATIIHQPDAWLALGGNERSLAADDVWAGHFAMWAPVRLAEAEGVAAEAMSLVHASLSNRLNEQADRDAAEMEQWLRLQADTLSGPALPVTDDLFGASPAGPAWRTLPMPLDRLAAFATDPANNPDRRRSASHAVALFHRRTSERKDRLTLASPVLRPIGMLMLLPDAFRA
ncbi:MAG TPA: helicase-related protein [Acetobacteraceae bacterium]|nr:helicase-related protein [Acetobacteraceae bacterium]